MFKKKTPVAAAKLDSPGTVIGKGVHIEAMRLTGEESVRIEGQFDGHINLHGSLVLGEAGRIVGDVFANYFLVAGEVHGNIRCATQLHLVSTARVAGDIEAPSLIVDEGSQVTGRFMVGADRVQETLQISGDTLNLENAQAIFDGVIDALEEDYEEDANE